MRLLRISVTNLLRRRRRTHPSPVDNRLMSKVEPEEVEMFVTSPNLAQGHVMMQYETEFRVLAKTAP